MNAEDGSSFLKKNYFLFFFNLRPILSYSHSHIVQITDFFYFLREYFEEKSETFTEFWTNFVLTRTIKIILWCAVVAKNQQKITYDREFSIVNSGGLKYMNF